MKTATRSPPLVVRLAPREESAVGDAGEDTGAGGAATGAGGSDGTTAPPGCTELVGLGDCGVTSMQAEYRVANIMLVIDKSKSMVDQPDGLRHRQVGGAEGGARRVAHQRGR